MSDRPRVSIIVPALNEGPNLAPLAEQIDAALTLPLTAEGGGKVGYEVLIIDDNSKDNTPQVAAELATRLPVRLIVRPTPQDGLSGAVLRGIAEARGDFLVVMDADLQHPPAKLPELLAPLERGEADFVLGSRYTSGGSTAEKWGLARLINSRVATFLARPFAGNTTDPMSGFFAMRRETFDRAEHLTPLGYKIGLELMCKSRVAPGRVREVPIHFAERTRGESKLTLREQFRYLEHLSRLYDFTFPRASPVIKFLIVLAASWFFAFLAFQAYMGIGIRPIFALASSYIGAIAVTALFHMRYVRTQREFIVRPTPWRDFLLISAAELAGCLVAGMWVLRRIDSPSTLELFAIPVLLATVIRYVLRKELLQDVRGLRKELRKEELT